MKIMIKKIWEDLFEDVEIMAMMGLYEGIWNNVSQSCSFGL
jgi:hypothetical protein